METNIEEISTVQRKIAVSVPADKVSANFESAYAKLQKKVQLKGFRKGKAPLNLVRSQYKQDVEKEVMNELITDSLIEIFRQHDFSPVTYPALDSRELTEDGRFNFTVTVEIRPQVEMSGYKGVVLERQYEEPEASDIDEVLEKVRERHSTLVDKKEGNTELAEEGDFADLSIKLSIDGKHIEAADLNHQIVQVGEAVLLPEVDAAVPSMKVGDSKTVEHQFDGEHKDSTVAGKIGHFEIYLNGLKQRELPTLDDDFAKSVGESESLDAFRETIAEQLREEWHKNDDRQLRHDAIEQVLNSNPFEVPNSLVRQRAESIMRRWIQSGMHTHNDKEARDMEQRCYDQALAEVRADIALEAVAKQENIEVSEAEVDAHLEELMKNEADRGSSEEDLKRMREVLRSLETRQSVHEQLKASKTVDFIMEKATIRDKKPVTAK